MIQERQLSEVLSEFARTLVTDFPIQGILDHLVERIVDVLPVASAGVTVISPGALPYDVAASDPSALRYEQMQTESGQGPCVSAYQTGESVSLPDVLAGDDRFPAFCSLAATAGLAAVFSFPLRHNDGRLGALDLYCDAPGCLEPADMAAAQTLADVTAAYLLNARARQVAGETTDRLRASTLHDALTGLPNRVLLQQRLEHAADRAQRSHSHAAVLFADLDGFKKVNDTFGHPVGDALLIAVAERLTNLLRPGDTLARVSGDEFVILCEDLQAAADVDQLATRIDEAFQAPFLLTDGDQRGIEVSISASVGMAFAGRADEIGHQLIRNADMAMYQAKRQGGASHRVYDLRAAGSATDHLELQRDLRAAFSHDKLDLAYQPIVNASDGAITGVEALLRWTHPSRGPIPTSAMVGIAEENSLIIDIGAWVLQRSCADLVRWHRQRPHQQLDLAVNVSGRQLMGPGFRDTVAHVLETTGMRPSSLILEMTEGVFVDDGPRALSVLTALKELGVRLALDDFGTGSSSLTYLRRFPLDIVKIDRGFVADIGHDPASEALIGAISNVAHVLGLSVTAEGVETAEQSKAVVAVGCESAQGFHYARPLSVVEISAWLAAERPASVRVP